MKTVVSLRETSLPAQLLSYKCFLSVYLDICLMIDAKFTKNLRPYKKNIRLLISGKNKNKQPRDGDVTSAIQVTAYHGTSPGNWPVQIPMTFPSTDQFI